MKPEVVLFLLPILISLALLLALRVLVNRRKRARSRGTLSIGFLHPHALSGGGGERVLWCAVRAIAASHPRSPLTIYSAWGSTIDAMTRARDAVQTQFGLDVKRVAFNAVDITPASTLIDPLNYPHFTLILQALGALLLGAIAYCQEPVDIIIDTSNDTFALVLPKLLGAQTVSYVHYPIVSSDMLAMVKSRRAAVNNSSQVASSPWRSNLKVLYYRAFALLYRIASQCTDVPLANSSWTAAHLWRIWKKRVPVIFPPCKVEVNADGVRDEKMIVSVGQFRPEKRHALQLDMMEHLQEHHSCLNCHLLMLGGARNSEDARRADELREDAKRRGLRVEVCVNAPREDLNSALRRSGIGVHTMRDEHFGISVVELQAAGLVVVAHRSGGVGMDIVKDGINGLLADGAAEYAEAVASALRMPAEQRDGIRESGRDGCRRFAEEKFEGDFAGALVALTGGS